MKNFFEDALPTHKTLKKRRHPLISDLQKSISQKEILERRDAMRYFINFIKAHNLNITTVLDMLSGRGIFAEVLLTIEGLEKLILNDISKDCYDHLKSKFKPPQITVLNQDMYSISINIPIDMVVIDFNTFTWNKTDQVPPFLNWVSRHRKMFSYLLFTDSFYYSLKFIKDASLRENTYQNYLRRTEQELSMKLLASYEYKTGNCSSLLLENTRGKKK